MTTVTPARPPRADGDPQGGARSGRGPRRIGGAVPRPGRGWLMRLMRRAVPWLLLPLGLIATALASSPWLRAFPSSVLAVPLFGAAVLSVLTPLIVVGVGVRRLWSTALIDLALFVFYELLVVLRAPAGFGQLWTGLVHGPSEVLTFALPLVSPRTLLVAPVALGWVCGAIVGECIARGWQTVVPYGTLLVTFGLAYAGSARAVMSADDGRRYDTVLAGAMLLALLLMRAAQAWISQEGAAETTQPDGVLPLRGLAIGASVALVIALAAAALGQSSVFTGPSTTPARVPPLNQTRPLTPLAFVSGLRPKTPRSAGTSVFQVTTDRPGTNYISIGSVDVYNGDSWGFAPDQTFRPSGGVVPADADRQLRPAGPPLTQNYLIRAGALTDTPWMPYVYRAQNVTGASVDVDPDNGMIVPSGGLRAGATYTVTSADTTTTFAALGANAVISSSAPAVDFSTGANLTVQNALGPLVSSLQQETGVPPTEQVQFLKAVAREFQTKSSLSGGTGGTGANSAPTAAGSASSTTASATPRPGEQPASRSSASAAASAGASAAAQHSGGTSFADVLASIRQFHAATPEQYATLMCLIARQIQVPARLVTGFRLPLASGATRLGAGTHSVTTAEAWTWVEIPVEGQGWVVLDPSPSSYTNRSQQPTAGATAASTPSATPSNALVTSASDGGHATGRASVKPTGHQEQVVGLVLLIIAIVAAALVLFFLTLLARKRLRTRRRRRYGDPRRRLLAAWQETLDVLQESGLPDLTALTSREVSAATARRFGEQPAEQVRELGAVANAAIFSPTSWIGADEADAAWQTHGRLSREVRRRLDWRRRIGAELRYHRPRLAALPVGPESWAAAAKARSASNDAGGKHARHRPGRRRP
ncbi:transglutaminase family protein [uncultured Jatrophihabitans sp.]|uniref:transglutaminase-like domain-containing protein n=1 Tax=uncultured Jatrophihabitans sp. TaxID=1610747 RepID=UPI0035CA4160